MASKKTHRSFTLRVPNELYLDLVEMAQAEGNIPINQLANRLLRLGMDKHIDLTESLKTLLMDRLAEMQA